MPNVFEGFDQQREQNVQKSAKDAFLDLSKQAPDAPTNDKAALGAWFQQYIQGGMNNLGHKVSSVDGDKFTYGNHEGNFTVDYGRGAGAPGGALTWQADPADDATRQRYGQSAPAPTTAPVVGVGRPGVSTTMPIMTGQDSNLIAQIMAALQQQQEPDPQGLLQQALR